jgi:hypothetical protein
VNFSQAQLRGGEPGSRPRIGADEVEQLVVQALCRQRGRDDQMADGASGAWSADIRELVRTAIDRIVIRHARRNRSPSAIMRAMMF